jgi:hypothetical protein
LAVVIAAGAGLLIGRVTADNSPAGASPPSKDSGPTCPGGHDDAGLRAATVCLLQAYFGLGNVPKGERDDKLTDLVLPSELDATRSAYEALKATVAQEYAAVAATNLPQNGDTVDGQAWVAFLDTYKDNSTPQSQWWITDFEMHWQSGRWWLSSRVSPTSYATPKTGDATPRGGYGPGWVAVGAS